MSNDDDDAADDAVGASIFTSTMSAESLLVSLLAKGRRQVSLLSFEFSPLGLLLSLHEAGDDEHDDDDAVRTKVSVEVEDNVAGENGTEADELGRLDDAFVAELLNDDMVEQVEDREFWRDLGTQAP